MTPQERLALLLKLSSPVRLPTGEAKEAIKILNSLEKYQPKTMVSDFGDRRYRVANPVIGGLVHANADGPWTRFDFATEQAGYDRPGVNRSRLQLHGIKALNAQVLDALPSRKNPDPNMPNLIRIAALFDQKDRTKQERLGKPSNARASAYNRTTGGVFQPYPPKKGEISSDWPAYTTKLSDDTWQPKDSKGRFMKKVTWDPASTIKPFKDAITDPKNVVTSLAGLLSKEFQALMTVDSIIEGTTGVSPFKGLAKQAEKNIKENKVQKPITLIRPPF